MKERKTHKSHQLNKVSEHNIAHVIALPKNHLTLSSLTFPFSIMHVPPKFEKYDILS